MQPTPNLVALPHPPQPVEVIAPLDALGALRLFRVLAVDLGLNPSMRVSGEGHHEDEAGDDEERDEFHCFPARTFSKCNWFAPAIMARCSV